jgi:hypothetical protein
MGMSLEEMEMRRPLSRDSRNCPVADMKAAR